jgi:hypothetical protein
VFDFQLPSVKTKAPEVQLHSAELISIAANSPAGLFPFEGWLFTA